MKTEIELPENVQELVDSRKVTYRDNGSIGGGFRLMVNGKEHLISRELFEQLGGNSKIRFKAPAKQG